MRIQKCSFCDAPVYPGHGMTFVRNDARIFHFCKSKCNKLFKLRRNPRKTRWTKTYRKAHGKELTVDTTLNFERRVNEPVRYERQLYQKTIQAMRRISEIRAARQSAFIRRRMRASEAVDVRKQIRELTHHLHLIRDPVQLEEASKALVAHKEFQERKKTKEVVAVQEQPAIAAPVAPIPPRTSSKKTRRIAR